MSIKELNILFDKIDKPRVGDGGCWNWIKSTNSAGYGQFTKDGKYYTTHRFVAIQLLGLNPEDLATVVRHICHNPKCCNPNHLVLGTNKDNYNDSKKIHQEAAIKRRVCFIIDDIKYNGIREANKQTRISMGSLVKYTNEFTRVFDVEAYRSGCLIANIIPYI